VKQQVEPVGIDSKQLHRNHYSSNRLKNESKKEGSRLKTGDSNIKWTSGWVGFAAIMN